MTSTLIIALLLLLLALTLVSLYLLSRKNKAFELQLALQSKQQVMEIQESFNQQHEKLMAQLHGNQQNINQGLADNNEKLAKEFANFADSLNKFDKSLSKQVGESMGQLLEQQHDSQEKLQDGLAGNKEKLSKEFASFTESLNKFDHKLTKQVGESMAQQLEQQQVNQAKLQEGLAGNNEKLSKEFAGFSDSLNTFDKNLAKQVTSNFTQLTEKVEAKLDNINNKVEERLKTGFEKTNETFQNIIARLSKIDEAQKNIQSLSSNIVSLQDVLTDKKSRGTFGEIQLNQILHAAFGEAKEGVYLTQYSFGNEKIADAVLFAPEPVGLLAIDAKFPLENYKRSLDKSLSEEERNRASQQFAKDLKKHIKDIASKYIIEGVTANQAILFLPAEAVFAEVHAYYSQVVEYAQSLHVWIASPTTLMAVLNTLQVILQNVEREKFAHIIQQELAKLQTEFQRYNTRWEKLGRSIDTVCKDVKDINISSNKITKRFSAIVNVDDSIKQVETTDDH